MRIEPAGVPMQQCPMAAEPGVDISCRQAGERTQRGEAHPPEQADQIGDVERIDRQVGQERRRLPHRHDEDVLCERLPRRLLGGEQPVGDAEPDVPHTEIDQPLGDDSSRLRFTGIELVGNTKGTQARTQRRHTRAQLLDGEQDVLERPRIRLRPMVGDDETRTPRLGVPTAHAAAHPVGPGGRIAGQDHPPLTIGAAEDGNRRTRRMFRHRSHHRPVRTPDDHRPH